MALSCVFGLDSCDETEDLDNKKVRIREQLRRREEAFAHTSRQEPVPEYTINDNNSGVVLNLPVDVLLKHVDKEIAKTLNPLEESIAKLNKIKEILGE